MPKVLQSGTALVYHALPTFQSARPFGLSQDEYMLHSEKTQWIRDALVKTFDKPKFEKDGLALRGIALLNEEITVAIVERIGTRQRFVVCKDGVF